ncbi:MAG TPA: glycosyltransferase family 4 protein [Pedobacter sp.]|uniref:glycosyltransferase family 4 protein n=1 Tax=Pedobacter sp. TaxID=1411316 RepID=UPI002CE7FA69|nr:glycosyltransferase family 4 protein [Pedobacter sp.]HMI00870.1 glycosyltransferase family 4 protein [Pedobacter sp.]
MKKLVFFLPDITTSGGVERVVCSLANALHATELYEVHILTSVKAETLPHYQLHSDICIDTLSCTDYPRNSFSKILWYLKLVEPLQKYIKQNSPDTIFSEGGYLSLCLALVRTRKTKKIGCEHINHKALNLVHSFVRRHLFKRLDALVVLTAQDQTYYQAFLRNVVLIPNFIDIENLFFEGSRDQTIVACGRLVNQKGFDLLIKAFYNVHKNEPGWNLVIYGEGTERHKLEKLTSDLALQSSVILPGFTKSIYHNLQRASIFVMPSRYEGFPLALLEAMTVGLPVICTNISGIDALIRNNENGLLVDPNNVTGIEKAILRLIGSSELRESLSYASRITASDYHVSVVIDKWQNLIGMTKHNGRNGI